MPYLFGESDQVFYDSLSPIVNSSLKVIFITNILLNELLCKNLFTRIITHPIPSLR